MASAARRIEGCLLGKMSHLRKQRLQKRCFQSSSIHNSSKEQKHELLHSRFRKLALEILEPVAAKLDKDGQYPAKQIAQLAEHGLMGLRAPVAFGGAGADMMSLSIAVEELSRCCASTGAIISIHNALFLDLLTTRGTEQQKSTYLAPYTSSKPGAFALTEAEAGSDVANISTTATREGESFVLNGCKTWVTSAKQAEVAIIFATLDRCLKHKGITAFLVPLRAPGVQLGKEDDKMGIRAVSTCNISLQQVVVPAENVVGELGGGFKLAMEQLNKARIGIASQALGISQAALDAALRYALQRRIFGAQLKDLQAVKIRLARMSARVESARLLVRAAAARCDCDEPFIRSSATAKLVASEAANFTAHQCVQIHGGLGYVKEQPAERHYRDARVTELYGGVSDVQMMIIADQMLSEFEKSRQDCSRIDIDKEYRDIT